MIPATSREAPVDALLPIRAPCHVMVDVDALGFLLLAAAAVGAGVINTVVGSGTLLTFPVLLALGVPSVAANVANTIGLGIGNISGVAGYRTELKGQGRRLLILGTLTVIGAIFGAFLLLRLPAQVFSIIVPFLILVGCALVAFQPLIDKRRRTQRSESRWRQLLTSALIFLTGTYGGYFGAAQGVLIVGVLDSTLDESLQRINAAKNVLQTLAGLTASVIFVCNIPIAWPLVAVIAVCSMVGAQLGARFGRRLPPIVLRSLILLIGVISVIAFAR